MARLLSAARQLRTLMQGATCAPGLSAGPLSPACAWGRRLISDTTDQQASPRPVPSWTVWDRTTRAYMVTSIIAPTWKALGPNTVVVDRKGTMLLKFATSRDPSKPAEEQAEPAAKTLFSLTATDLGALLQNPLPEQLTFSRRAQGVETTAGTDRTLNVSRAAGGGVTFSITEASREGAVLNQLDVNMSAADFEVLRSVAMYSIPGLLGFTASLV